MILKIKNFTILADFKINITFSTNETLLVDLKNELYGEIFNPLKNPIFFNKAYLSETNVIEWPNEADFAPEFLYKIGKKAS